MQILRKTKSGYVVSISTQELAVIASALDAKLASGSERSPLELERLLGEIREWQAATPTPPSVPEILRELVALALASKG